MHGYFHTFFYVHVCVYIYRYDVCVIFMCRCILNEDVFLRKCWTNYYFKRRIQVIDWSAVLKIEYFLSGRILISIMTIMLSDEWWLHINATYVGCSYVNTLVGEKEYYESQFATLKSFEEVDVLVDSDCFIEEDLQEQVQHERAMKISNYANIVLLACKVIKHYYQSQSNSNNKLFWLWCVLTSMITFRINL